MKVYIVLNFAMGVQLIIVQVFLHRPVYFLEAESTSLARRKAGNFSLAG